MTLLEWQHHKVIIAIVNISALGTQRDECYFVAGRGDLMLKTLGNRSKYYVLGGENVDTLSTFTIIS